MRLVLYDDWGSIVDEVDGISNVAESIEDMVDLHMWAPEVYEERHPGEMTVEEEDGAET